MHDVSTGDAPDNAQDHNQDDDRKGMGTRLRQLRLARSLTIGELAARADLSIGIISQIERGKSNPSMKTLKRVRDALGITLWALLDPGTSDLPQDAPFVRRSRSRPRMEVGQGRLRIHKELLSIIPDSHLRFMTIDMPGGSSTDDVVIGAGEKGGFVLEGELELTVDGQAATLRPGDSFHFYSDRLHRLANRGTAAAKLLWIMTMPIAPL